MPLRKRAISNLNIISNGSVIVLRKRNKRTHTFYKLVWILQVLGSCLIIKRNCKNA